jgi:MSHA biogenesis protein MshM
MYESHWNLERNPFEDDIDFRTFFQSETHRGALLKFRYLIEQGKGAGLLTGGTGTGKTYILQALSREFSDPYGPFIHLLFPQMSAHEFLGYLAGELGADPHYSSHGTVGMDRIVREIDDSIRRHNDQGRQPVIIIHEAHLIDELAVLQSLRLLLNFQQVQRLQFSLILSGQNELLEQVRRVGPLEERIAVKSVLQPLTAGETADYVAHRLAVAGGNPSIFQEDAYDTLYDLSGGVPRRINRLCDLALLMAYADDCKEVSARQLEAVSDELLVAVAD